MIAVEHFDILVFGGGKRHLAATPSVHLPELSPGAAAGGMVSALWPCFSSPQML
jgi:hypothetical protein